MKGNNTISSEGRNIWNNLVSLPIIYRLVILKHLKNNIVLMKNESYQQLNENA